MRAMFQLLLEKEREKAVDNIITNRAEVGAAVNSKPRLSPCLWSSCYTDSYPVAQRRRSLGHLITKLGFDEIDVKRELLDCLRRLANLSNDEIESLTLIKQSGEFALWALTSRPEVLLIQYDERTTSQTTHTSFLCADMAHLLSGLQGVIALTYVHGSRACAVQSSMRTIDLMLSLIGQLIGQWPSGCKPAEIEKADLQKLRKGANFQSLFRILRTIILKLPKELILCVMIDGVDNFELELQETAIMISNLIFMSHETDQDGCTSKLLFTTSNRSLYEIVARVTNVLYVSSEGGLMSQQEPSGN